MVSWPQINSFRLALFVYAQNITRLQVQNVEIPVVLNIYLNQNRRLFRDDAPRLCET
jgi:hypothetical protein